VKPGVALQILSISSSCKTQFPLPPLIDPLHLLSSGDSYSDVRYDDTSPHPTRENPLGVEFPGFTYAEPEEPNWVGHLITEYSPNPNLLVYDYAMGGSRIYNVKNQVERQFLEHAGKKPDWAPWSAGDTIFSEFFLAFVLLRLICLNSC